MNGNDTQILKMQTVITATVGLARKNTSPNPNAFASFGIGLSGVASSQFHDVEVTTTGTTQGSNSSTLKVPRPGILVRSSNARPKPTSQLPNTPAMVKITV